MATALGVEGAIVHGKLIPGDVEIEDGRIASIGERPGVPGGGAASVGFLDLQVNGYAGVDLLTASEAGPDAFVFVGDRLADLGVTAWLPAFVTAPEQTVTRALHRLATVRQQARCVGAHLEGPFISSARLGAHEYEHRRDPDLALLRRFFDAGPISLVTLAPELPGAFSLIDACRERNIAVSAGHTQATTAQVVAAFDAGVSAVTHIFNAMAPITAREPGPAGLALTRPDVIVQAIVDGVHLDDSTLRIVLALAGPDRLAVVSDSVAVAGLDDGAEATLNGRRVRLHDGAARLEDGRLAGATSPLPRAVHRLIALGMPLVEAVGCATWVPARLIGRPDLGTLSIGAPADVVVLADDGAVTRVYVDGVARS